MSLEGHNPLPVDFGPEKSPVCFCQATARCYPALETATEATRLPTAVYVPVLAGFVINTLDTDRSVAQGTVSRNLSTEATLPPGGPQGDQPSQRRILPVASGPDYAPRLRGAPGQRPLIQHSGVPISTPSVSAPPHFLASPGRASGLRGGTPSLGVTHSRRWEGDGAGAEATGG